MIQVDILWKYLVIKGNRTRSSSGYCYHCPFKCITVPLNVIVITVPLNATVKNYPALYASKNVSIHESRWKIRISRERV